MLRWPEPGARRVRVLVCGIVQGVGFRPFLHRLAARLGLGGWARNTPAGVELELEGPPDALQAFLQALRTQPPPLAVVEQVQVQPLAACRGETSFTILPSTEEHHHLHGEVVSYGILAMLTIDKKYQERDKVLAFNRSIGLPTRLSDIHAKPEDLPAVAEKALQGIDVRKWPYEVTVEMIVKGIQELEAATR